MQKNLGRKAAWESLIVFCATVLLLAVFRCVRSPSPFIFDEYSLSANLLDMIPGYPNIFSHWPNNPVRFLTLPLFYLGYLTGHYRELGAESFLTYLAKLYTNPTIFLKWLSILLMVGAGLVVSLLYRALRASYSVLWSTLLTLVILTSPFVLPFFVVLTPESFALLALLSAIALLAPWNQKETPRGDLFTSRVLFCLALAATLASKITFLFPVFFLFFVFLSKCAKNKITYVALFLIFLTLLFSNFFVDHLRFCKAVAGNLFLRPGEKIGLGTSLTVFLEPAVAILVLLNLAALYFRRSKVGLVAFLLSLVYLVLLGRGVSVTPTYYCPFLILQIFCLLSTFSPSGYLNVSPRYQSAGLAILVCLSLFGSYRQLIGWTNYYWIDREKLSSLMHRRSAKVLLPVENLQDVFPDLGTANLDKFIKYFDEALISDSLPAKLKLLPKWQEGMGFSFHEKEWIMAQRLRIIKALQGKSLVNVELYSTYDDIASRLKILSFKKASEDPQYRDYTLVISNPPFNEAAYLSQNGVNKNLLVLVRK